jgi:TnpA family transposase
MPTGFLTDAERDRLSNFPAELPQDDVIAYFTLSASDRAAVPRTSAPANRLGFSVQLGTLRCLGFCPPVARTPATVVQFVAEQLGVRPEVLKEYGRRRPTVAEHYVQVQAHLGFRRPSTADKGELTSWLVERALEHDRPTLLLELACDRLRRAKVTRPALNRLERIVGTARARARRETYRLVSPLLTPARRATLDALLVADEETGRTPLSWLRQDVTRSTPRSISEMLDKLRYVEPRVEGLDLDALTPNHRKFLAQIGNKSSSRALALMNAERRYPILLAFLQRAHEEVTDETLTMFDRCIADTDARAGRDLKDLRLKAAVSTEEKVRMLREVLGLVTDPSIADEKLREAIVDHLTEEVLLAALAECDELARPEDGGHFDLLADRFSSLRQFTPAFLAAFDFRSHRPRDPLLGAIEVVRELNASPGRPRFVSDDATVAFIPERWRTHVVDDEGRLRRRGYELCVLWQLRESLRCGDVWVARSRRYADPESYLIPKDRWPSLRVEVCSQVGAPSDGEERIAERRAELEALLRRVDERLPGYNRVRIEDGELVVPHVTAEDRPASLITLERLVDERLPLVELSDLLLEVDGMTGFSMDLQHAGGAEPRTKNLLVQCHASILAQACNLGLTRMAQGADLSYEKLAWTTRWYLREETLRAAFTRIVNFQHRQPLAQFWGTGGFSSSDGQRFAVPIRSRTASCIPRYFGYGRGMTAQTWTSDQFSQYGSKPTISTVREATYVLDAILDNESELEISEHTTDTNGYTDIVFALFDLLGLKFMPRLRDPGSRRLFRIDKTIPYRNIGPLLSGTVRPSLILKRWDAMLRVTGSLKLGWVTSSLFLSKLQARERKTEVAAALEEYGRLVRTIFLLQYVDDEALRRRIGKQLNKGEAMHSLRRFLFLAKQGQIRRAAYEEQLNQMSCLNVVANAVVAWNTVYMHAVLEQLRAEGHTVNDDDVAHLSPARFEHINPYGKFRFDLSLARRSAARRPLRRP